MAKYTNYGDASNTSVRVFLTQAGVEYDKKHNRESLNGHKGYNSHKAIAIKFQKSCCFYCDTPFDEKNKEERDHVIPMNRDFGGIHCWGNVIYCCSGCNSDKHNFKDGNWQNYLDHMGKTELYSGWVAMYSNGQKESKKLISTCREIYKYIDLYLRKKVADT